MHQMSSTLVVRTGRSVDLQMGVPQSPQQPTPSQPAQSATVEFTAVPARTRLPFPLLKKQQHGCCHRNKRQRDGHALMRKYSRRLPLIDSSAPTQGGVLLARLRVHRRCFAEFGSFLPDRLRPREKNDDIIALTGYPCVDGREALWP